MSPFRWRPLWARKAAKQLEYDALLPGVPAHLRQALIDWLNDHFFYDKDRTHRRGRRLIREAIRLVEVQVRVPNIDWSVSDEWALRSLFEKGVVDGELFLSVVDLALKVIPKEEQSPREHLDNLLRLGGSALTIAPDGLSLVGRVQPEALQAARHVVEAGSRAGEYLAEAWRHAYGRNPHAGTAYREAVRAIEAAVCPVIIPKNPKPTLGTAIAALRDAPQGKFATAFEDVAPSLKPLDAVRGMMELVWTNQLDRHGTHDEAVPLHVSQKQAEAAVQMAVTLVQWFQAGVVKLASA